MFKFAPFLRQWAYPKALRIDDPGEAGIDAALLEMARLVAVATPPPQAPPAAPAPVPDAVPAGADTDEGDAFMAKLATNIWRLAILARRLDGLPAGRAIANRIEAATTLLKQRGVEYFDYSGQDFDEGELWDDLVSELMPDGARPFIASMQSPRVRRHGRLLQRGVPILADRNQSPPEGAAP